MFIFIRPNPAEQRFQDLGARQHLTVLREFAVSVLAVLLLVVGLLLTLALLAAAAAGILARMDGATYPAAITRAATAFLAVLTLAAAATGALASVLR